MSTTTIDPPTSSGSEAPVPASKPVVALKRRTIDAVLIGFGVVATVVFSVAGGLLTWGSSFANDYVKDELSSQKIVFPSAESLTEEGRDDLVKYAGQPLDNGDKAEAYASYIDGHLQETADGMTYAELGTPQRAARAELAAAKEANAPQAEIDELQAKVDGLTAQRNSLFTGETLRGLLLSAYAWSSVGDIAGYAAIGAFIAAGLMLILSVLGVWHHHKTPKMS